MTCVYVYEYTHTAHIHMAIRRQLYLPIREYIFVDQIRIVYRVFIFVQANQVVLQRDSDSWYRQSQELEVEVQVQT